MRTKHSRKKRILVLYTGGTFGMDANLKIPDLSANALKLRLSEQVPEMEKLADCEVEIISNLDSCEMNSTHWFTLALRLNQAKKDFDGAVILHGTDTLPFTASALSFLLSPCPFPIVLTGAQKPLATLRNDARNNFISSLELATLAPAELQNRVLVVFHDEVFLGSRIRKKSALDFSAFESPRFPVLAKIGSTMIFQDAISHLPTLARENLVFSHLIKNKPRASASLFPSLLRIEITPHFPSSVFTDVMLKKIDGILLTLYPSGTAPSLDLKFMEFLKRAKKTHTPVFAITEREDAPIKLSTYGSGKLLEEEGVIWCHDLTPEASFVRACFLKLIHHKLSRENFLNTLKIKNARLWNTPLSDEKTDL